MPIIPRSDRNSTTSGQPLPFSTGDGYEAPGRAMMRVGDAIGDLGSAFGRAAEKAEAEREEADLFQTKLMLTDWTGQQEVKTIESEAKVSGDGRDYPTTRLQQYDADAKEVLGRVPQSKRAQQFAQMHVAGLRARYAERAAGVAQTQQGRFYESATNDLITRQIIPTVSGNVESVEKALGAVDGILGGANGMPPAVADKVKRQAAEQVFKAWLDKAGPEAAVQVEQLRSRYIGRFQNEMEDTARANPSQGAGPDPASRVLASDRKRFFDELDNDPQLAAVVRGLIRKENYENPHVVLEAMMNRASMRNSTIRKEVFGGFYGPINRGEVKPTGWDDVTKAAFDRVRAGSNDIRLNTDQGYVGYYKGQFRNEHAPALKIGIQPEKIKGEHFSPMGREGVAWKQAMEKRIAEGGGVGGIEAPRTTAGYFLDRVMQSAPQIERAAIAAERKMEIEERRAVRQEQIAAGREALDLVAKGQLTRQWVEENGPRLNATDFRRYSRMVNPIVRATSPDVLSNLMTKVDEDPQNTMDEALDAYAAGTLSYRDLSNVISQARAHASEQDGVPRWAKDERAALKRAIKPPPGATGDMHKAYVEALTKWDSYVAENKDSIDRAGLRKFTQTFIDDARTDRLFEMKQGLETPRTVKTSREAIDLNAIMAARTELARQLKAGAISREDAAVEAKRLKAWQDTLEQEAIAKGKPLPGAQGAAASTAPKKSGQKSSDGPGRTVPVGEMQRRAKDLEPDPALNVGAP